MNWIVWPNLSKIWPTTASKSALRSVIGSGACCSGTQLTITILHSPTSVHSQQCQRCHAFALHVIRRNLRPLNLGWCLQDLAEGICFPHATNLRAKIRGEGENAPFGMHGCGNSQIIFVNYAYNFVLPCFFSKIKASNKIPTTLSLTRYYNWLKPTLCLYQFFRKRKKLKVFLNKENYASKIC